MAKIERMENCEACIEVFENDIDLYLHQFMEEQGIEDLKTTPQSVWNGALRYIYNHVFKNNPEILKSRNLYNMDNNIIPSTCNMYNYDLLLELADYYIYSMCMVYNKEVSILGFSTLTGIDDTNIYNWGNERGKLSTSAFNIYKKLSSMREESLSNKLADGKQNPVGVIAMLNRHYGWASPYTSDANKGKRQALSQEDLIKLKQNPEILQIESTKTE